MCERERGAGDQDCLVTVLVPTYGRSAKLERCIQSIVDNRHPSFRVVIIDQTEGSPCLNIAHDGRVQHVRVPFRGKSRALNLGLKLTRSPFIALTDDDTEVDPNWIEDGLEALCRSERTGLVFGAVNPSADHAEDGYVPTFRPRRAKRVSHGSAVAIPGVGMGANMFARAEAVRTVGGWDVALGPGGLLRSGDDWDLAYRLVTHGYEIRINPRPTVTHFGSRSVEDGAASNLVYDNFFGVGAGIAKYLRCGEPSIAIAAARTLGRCSVDVLKGMALSGRPRNGRRFFALARGFGAGWSAGIDRESRLFIDSSVEERFDAPDTERADWAPAIEQPAAGHGSRSSSRWSEHCDDEPNLIGMAGLARPPRQS
ncbi:MAG: glycosyltransferase family 2 protein [Dehalococcoidia bacterium]